MHRGAWKLLFALLAARGLGSTTARADEKPSAPLASVSTTTSVGEPPLAPLAPAPPVPPIPEAPPRTAGEVPGGGPSTAATAFLVEVGRREKTLPHHAFALGLLSRLGVALAPELLSAPDGASLLASARALGACEVEPAALAGDLVVFGDGWLVGVVAATRPNGAVELVYLFNGVVRRGYVHVARPSARRDDEGRVLNTFVRPYDKADPPGQAHLAGELFTCFVRLDDMIARASTTPQ